jgi:hypothetical protein
MGFLDHSTNNIILDAVLTDVGRQFLARNDGSFSIHKFALGDDEVNYAIVKKYGRTVGREKIEKNTPIFEAMTNQAYSQKFKLVSIPNPHLLVLPKLELTGNTPLTLGRNTQQSTQVNVEQKTSDAAIDPWLRDEIFIVDVPNLFCQIVDEIPENIDAYQKASYLLKYNSTNGQGGAILGFTLKIKSLTDAMFDVYGTSTNKTKIRTYVKITGVNSGSVLDVLLEINKS